MNIQDDSRDEIRLSWPIIERFSGCFRFGTPPGPNPDQLAPVDIQATNEHVALCNRRLDDFVTVPPLDSRVIPVDRLPPATSSGIDPREMVLVMLCGGLSFRSQGEIHPLRRLLDPQTKDNRTLLDRQLDRLVESPLNQSPCVIAATPMNEDAIRQHIGGLSTQKRPRICIGGLAPRLLPSQRRSGPPLVVREPSGEISYNPAGHLEALRWLILSGTLSEFVHSKVIVIASYSNWGQLFDSKMVDIAGSLARGAQTDDRLLFLAEVTERDIDQERGSILVSDDGSPDNLRLVKFSYGRGRPRLALGNRVLMSTNTLYFSTANLLERLRIGTSSVGLPGTGETVRQLLCDAAACCRRDQLSHLFEASFPVEPHLIPVPSEGTPAFLRVERDLDQLTLIPGQSLIRAVEVPAERGVFLKLPSDFEDPAKLAFVFRHAH